MNPDLVASCRYLFTVFFALIYFLLSRQCVMVMIEILEYVKCYTNFSTHPTSTIINIIIRDYIMNQTCVDVALKSYIYLDKVMVDNVASNTMLRSQYYLFPAPPVLWSRSNFNRLRLQVWRPAPGKKICYTNLKKKIQI